MKRIQVVGLMGILFLLHAGLTHAMERATPSVDCLTVRSDQVLIGQVIRFRDDVRPDGGYCPRVADIQVHEWLLGGPAEAVTIESCVCWWEFLDAGPAQDAGSTVDAGSARRAGPTELLVFLRDGRALAVFPLDSPLSCHVLLPMDNDFGVLADGVALLRAVRARLERLETEPRPQGELFLAIPIVIDANGRPDFTRGDYLWIPADPERLPEVVRQLSSAEEWERSQAAEHLHAYPGPSTIALLRTCLADTARAFGVSDRGPFMYYPVRNCAWRSLQSMGVVVDKPDLYVDF